MRLWRNPRPLAAAPNGPTAPVSPSNDGAALQRRVGSDVSGFPIRRNFRSRLSRRRALQTSYSFSLMMQDSVIQHVRWRYAVSKHRQARGGWSEITINSTPLRYARPLGAALLNRTQSPIRLGLASSARLRPGTMAIPVSCRKARPPLRKRCAKWLFDGMVRQEPQHAAMGAEIPRDRSIIGPADMDSNISMASWAATLAN